jgi:hypothetical protein
VSLDRMRCATAQKLIGLIEEAEPDNSCYIEALGRVLAHG